MGRETGRKATGRPWRADPDGEIIGAAPSFDGGESIAMVLLNEEGPVNAALIVLAVNNFDALRELLAAFIDAAGNPPPELLTRAAALFAAIDGERGHV